MDVVPVSCGRSLSDLSNLCVVQQGVGPAVGSGLAAVRAAADDHKDQQQGAAAEHGWALLRNSVSVEVGLLTDG